MSVRVRAKLPKGESNGLAFWEEPLASKPDAPIVVVALVRADTIEARPHDPDDPQVVKTVFLGVEAFDPNSAEGKAAEGLLREAYQERTGKLVLPFEDDDE